MNWQILRDVCGDDNELFELQTELIDIERKYRGMSRRAGIYEALEDRLKIHQFQNEEEALAIRREEERRRNEAESDAIPTVQKTLFEIIEPEEIDLIP